MPRVKRGKVQNKKRKALLKYTKGFRWDRKSKERAAKEALLHAQSRAFRGRKEKKRVFRKLWNVRINAASRTNEMTYSKLIAALKAKKIKLDRKILSDFAQNEPKIFAKVVEFVKK